MHRRGWIRGLVSTALSVTVLVCGSFGLLWGSDAQAQNNPRVKIDTNQGAIVVELDPVAAPKSVANFLNYVKAGHYSGTLFHRVIDGFMIQGGGFDERMSQKPTQAPIELESRNGLKNLRGTIAMARTSAPNSATSQFFINLVDNNMLDHPNPDGFGYAVFGKVTEGMDVVDKIAKLRTTGVGMHRNVPAEPVTIRSVTQIK